MPVVDDLQFDTTGWEPRAEAAEDRRAWANSFGDVLSLRFNSGVPKIPSLFRSQALRDYYTQQIALAGGCILSLDLLHVKGVAIAKLIFKTPQSAGGWGYMGSLNLAYKDFSYSLRIQTLEVAGDDARGQYVWNQLQDSQSDEADCLALWFGSAEMRDSDVVRPCLADHERWDGEFPQHPLSRLRAELSRIAPSMVVSRDIKNSQPHRG